MTAAPAGVSGEGAAVMLVLAVGTLGLDSVETPAGAATDVPGGSALYFAAGALHAWRRGRDRVEPGGGGDADGRRSPRLAVVGVVGDDYPDAPLRRLAAAGVDVTGVARRPGPSFRWKVRYGPDLASRETLETNRGTTLGVVPQVPEPLSRPAVTFLGSTDPSVQHAVLEQLDDPGVVVADTMEHWIRGRRSDLEAVLARTRVLLVNEEECAFLGGNPVPLLAARVIRALGPEWVVVKRGARGALALSDAGEISVPAVPVEAPVDPTGAGDAFAGGLVAALVGGSWRTAPGGGTAEGVTLDAGTLRRALAAGVTLDAGTVRRALEAGAATGARAVTRFSVEGLLGAGASGA